MDNYKVIYYVNGSPNETTVNTDEVEVITDGNGFMSAIFFNGEDGEDLVAAFSQVISIQKLEDDE